MKLARIGLHAAFTILIMASFAGATAVAAGTSSSGNNKSGSPATDLTNTQPQGYASDGTVQSGTIVELTDKATRKVATLPSKDISSMFGAVVNRGDLTFTVGSDTLQNEVYVATSGTYNVLVSNQNGAIKSGDYITISAVNGVGMKADTRDKEPVVLGQAAGNFDGKTNVVGEVPLKNTDGSSASTAKLGLIPVAINIKPNPLVKSTKVNLPPFLQKVGQEIAQHQVSEVRIIISVIITGLSIIISLTVLYSGVRNSIISIGRNPLSRGTIFRGLIEVILAGFLILIIGMFAVYLLLKL